MVKICLLSSERSGSNLLRLMLGSHNQISATSAPHIVNNLGKYIHFYGDLENPRNLEELVCDMLSLIEIHPYPWKHKFTVKDIINNIQQTSFWSIWDYLYTLNAELEGKKNWFTKENKLFSYACKILHLQKKFSKKFKKQIMLRLLYKNILYKLIFLFLRYWGGEKFANQDFSPFILLKHLFIQKILRINSHVPWPVHPTSKISCIDKIDPGSRCPGLSPGCYIQALNGIILGKNVWIGANVGIISANHSLDNYFQHTHDKPIKIGDNCWIGMNSIILPGVEIGNHVIVGAGSIVTHSFESNCVIAGNPARIIKRIGEYQGRITKSQLLE